MDLKKFLLLTSILLALFLLLLSQKYTNQTTIEGKITKINHYPTSITLYLENREEEFVIFTNYLNLKENQTITLKGKAETYQNKTQILVDKIII